MNTLRIAHLRIGHMVGNPEVGNPEVGNPEIHQKFDYIQLHSPERPLRCLDVVNGHQQTHGSGP